MSPEPIGVILGRLVPPMYHHGCRPECSAEHLHRWACCMACPFASYRRATVEQHRAFCERYAEFVAWAESVL